MKTFSMYAMAALLAVTARPTAQINLEHIHSWDVKEAVNVDTRIDSLLVETEVGGGIARTRITMEVTPQPHVTVERPDLHAYGLLDSIEITLRFSLPTDFTGTNMILWVDGEPQTAYIQDRNIAWAQYSSIVGVRLDPALWEFWGDGSYNLRIFPAQSNKSRKIALDFEHTFDDDSAGYITASIPLAFDSSYYYYIAAYDGIHRTIGGIRVTLTAADNKTYGFSMDGVGAGTFTKNNPLTLESSGVSTLGPGTIRADDPSGKDEFFWNGRDKDDVLVAGFSTMLSESTVVLDDEPKTRIIVVDIREQLWNWNEYERQRSDFMGYEYYPYGGNETIDIWERARKYAVLSIYNYVKSGNEFNVIFAGEEPRAVFDSPVEPSRRNLDSVFSAIIAARPDPAAVTADALALAAAQAPDGIVILISDLFSPYDYYTFADGGSHVVTENGKAYDLAIDSLEEKVSGYGITLFTVSDDWQLSQIAMNSGGFTLASLRWEYYYADYYAIDAAGDRSVFRLPDLFLDNYQGIRGVTVSVNGLENVTWTVDGSGYGWWWGRGEVVLMDAVAKRRSPARLAKMVLPWQEGPNSSMLRVAGTFPPERSNPQITATITGKMGGLGFTKEIHGALAPQDAGSGAVQWAFRKSEHLAHDNWQENGASIKALGMEYHIVTRQTSLLALEPGMELWKDTAGAPESGRSEGASTADASFAPLGNTKGSGAGVDDISLEEIIAGISPAVNPVSAVQVSRFDARWAGKRIAITMPDNLNVKTITLALFDLQGKTVARAVLADAALGAQRYVWDVNGHVTPISRGYYVLKIRWGMRERCVKLPFRE